MPLTGFALTIKRCLRDINDDIKQVYEKEPIQDAKHLELTDQIITILHVFASAIREINKHLETPDARQT